MWTFIFKGMLQPAPPNATNDGNVVHSNNIDSPNSFIKESRQDQWMMLWESLQLFIMYLLLTMMVEGLLMAILLFSRNRKLVQAADHSNSISAEGSSPTTLDNCNLYPILNLAGENTTAYLKPLDSKKFLQVRGNGENVIERSDRRIYSLQKLCSIKNSMDFDKDKPNPDILQKIEV